MIVEPYRRSTRYNCNDALIIDVHSALIPDANSQRHWDCLPIQQYTPIFINDLSCAFQLHIILV